MKIVATQTQDRQEQPVASEKLEEDSSIYLTSFFYSFITLHLVVDLL